MGANNAKFFKKSSISKNTTVRAGLIPNKTPFAFGLSQLLLVDGSMASDETFI